MAGNPFIDKTKKRPATPDYDPDGGMVPASAYQKKNPFVKKAEEAQIKVRAKEIAETNYRALQDIFNRYDKDDRSEARERIRLRVIEAREAVESLG